MRPLKEHQKQGTKDVFSDTWNNFKYVHIFCDDETLTDDFRNP